MDPYDLTQPFASRKPIPPPMLPTSPSRGAFLNQTPNPVIPTTGAARYWYVDPRAQKPFDPVRSQLLDLTKVRDEGDTPGLMPKNTPYAFSKGGRSKDTIPAMLSKGEVVLTPKQQKKVGVKRIREAIGNRHGEPIDGGAYGFQYGGEVVDDQRTQPYLNPPNFKMGSAIPSTGFMVAGDNDRSELNDMLNQDPSTQFLGKPNTNPQPTPTPTPPPNVTQKMLDGWSKTYGWGGYV